jgi:6-hydroxycyclohex-1-ene-1-carbonyl-CoA dehydrogenase
MVGRSRTADHASMPRIEGAYGQRLVNSSGQLAITELPPIDPSPDHVVVEVAGCGLCHTDIGFAFDGVPTRHPLPLILGHEIAGRVVAAGEGAADWVGRSVIVPAVIPCGACAACAAGRPAICRNQFMPGNDGDGGFASHVAVPARGLCLVPDSLPAGITLDMLSVVADAVTTPFEAMTRAEVGVNDLVIVVGAGGIGGFAVQIATALGATVVAIDVDDERLAFALAHGATLAMNPKNIDARGMKTSIRGLSRETGSGLAGWKVFEMSGTPAGQQTAFALLDFGAVGGLPPSRAGATEHGMKEKTMTSLEVETIVVRNLEHSDLPDVVRIDAEAAGRRRPEYFELMLMRALNFAGLQMSLVAVLDGRVAGYMIVSLYYGEYGISEPTASIDAVGVAADARRQGVAHAMMRQFRANAAAIGVSVVRTEVQWDDFDLMAFFRGEEFAPAQRICLERKVT